MFLDHQGKHLIDCFLERDLQDVLWHSQRSRGRIPVFNVLWESRVCCLAKMARVVLLSDSDPRTRYELYLTFQMWVRRGRWSTYHTVTATWQTKRFVQSTSRGHLDTYLSSSILNQSQKEQFKIVEHNIWIRLCFIRSASPWLVLGGGFVLSQALWGLQ